MRRLPNFWEDKPLFLASKRLKTVGHRIFREGMPLYFSFKQLKISPAEDNGECRDYSF